MLWVLGVVFVRLKPRTKSNLHIIAGRGAHQFLGRHLKCVADFSEYYSKATWSTDRIHER